MYSGVKDSSEIEKAKEREYKKAIRYTFDDEYILHFKMVFEKEKIKLNLSEENYINNLNVPYNPVTKRIKKEYTGKSNIYADWDRFKLNERLLKFANERSVYPFWAIYDWIDGKLVYNKNYLKMQKKAILKNYRLNIKFYDKLKKCDFDKSLNKLLEMKENKNLKKVEDLKEFFGIKGIYVMILDKYKQIYVGQSKSDVVARIIQHWKKRIEFENLLTGSIYEEKLKIDSFGILDTTRIYIEEVKESLLDKREEELVDLIPEDYLANKVAGGLKLNSISARLEMNNKFKKRKLK